MNNICQQKLIFFYKNLLIKKQQKEKFKIQTEKWSGIRSTISKKVDKDLSYIAN
ncbi:hypothetical protein AXA84_0119 [Candidatus Phytoplasma oryzae]|uniref:Uncharacterized protein n=1 Tax=Candidatus Phytoplasma oryzae TaxID=203274 RepID=A0A139JR66_9MOLU|nr:hypothetical protein [Candidatus Phytoplasma oryzae]KXT29473.1 hypothetical protein AXA84_0119 [Candidatus Phytoplasma oryzae]